MAIPYVSFVSCTSNQKSAYAALKANIEFFGGILVGLDVGADLNIDERYLSHPSEKYMFNPVPMIVCFAPGFVLTGNIIGVMGQLIDYVDDLLEHLKATCSV